MDIRIEQTNETDTTYKFSVVIGESGSQLEHTVKAEKDYVEKLTGGTDARALVEWSFGFLLEHEPKEAILPKFDLLLIQKYFPDYEETAQKHFARGQTKGD